jgi:putative ABC transport system permease protein
MRDAFTRYRALIADTLDTAFRSIWASRQRALLTSLGVITGCMAFTASYGALRGKLEADLREYWRLGVTYVSVSTLSGELRAEHGEELGEQVPGIVAVSPVYAANTSIRTRITSTDGAVVGTSADLRRIFDLRVTSGRFFTQAEVDAATDVCVIGADLARRLKLRIFGSETPAVHLFDQPFRVIGVMEERAGSMPGCGAFNSCVVIPHKTMRELLPSVPLAQLAVHAKSEKAVKPVAEAIRYRLRRMLGRTSFDPDGFEIYQAADIIEQLEREMRTGIAILMGIVTLTLLVGGIGVMNIMLVTVVERTPEIGLRKAVGARSREILLQFLVESLCLCTGGGLIGTGLGVALAHLIMDFIALDVDPHLPWPLILASVGFAVFTGVLFGFAPAVKASRLSPLEALRRD